MHNISFFKDGFGYGYGYGYGYGMHSHRTCGRIGVKTMGNIFIKVYKEAPNDEKVMDLEVKFGLHYSFGLYIKLLLLMCESENHRFMKCKRTANAMRLHMPEQELMDFLDYAVEINLLEKDKDSYFSTRFLEDMDKVDKNREKNKENAMKRWHPVDEDNTEDNTEEVKPKAKPVKKEKIPDTELSKYGQQIKAQIDAILSEAVSSPDGLVKNKNCTLTNRQIDALLDKFGYSKLTIMARLYYEWKITSRKMIKDDNLAIQKSWVEEKAEEYQKRHGGIVVKTDYSTVLKEDSKEKQSKSDEERKQITELNKVKWNEHESYRKLVGHIANFPHAKNMADYIATMPKDLIALANNYNFVTVTMGKAPIDIDETYNKIKRGYK